jgi:hypothetical protein
MIPNRPDTPQAPREGDRRRFLLAAAYTPALALAGAQPAPTLAAPQPSPEPPSSGYRETDHIRRYYASAQY